MIEVVVTLAIFGTFLAIIVVLTAEMRKNEQRHPINYMAHPEVSAVMARLRKDVLDTTYYPEEFRCTSPALRKSFNATQLTADWVARGVPVFEIGHYDLPTGQTAVRITATDEQNRMAIDEILVPRPHG